MEAKIDAKSEGAKPETAIVPATTAQPVKAPPKAPPAKVSKGVDEPVVLPESKPPYAVIAIGAVLLIALLLAYATGAIK